MIDYKDLLERVVSTFLQATGGMIAVDQIVDMGADQWKLVQGPAVPPFYLCLKDM